MAETKWTPGAWVAYYDDRADEWSVRINTHGHWGIYTEIADLGGPDPEPQIEANAHLIAAAPELYEALEDLLSDVERQMKNPSHHQPFSYPKALAVLKKARGE